MMGNTNLAFATVAGIIERCAQCDVMQSWNDVAGVLRSLRGLAHVEAAVSKKGLRS